MQMANVVALGCKKVGIIVYLGTKNYFLPQFSEKYQHVSLNTEVSLQSQITKGYS